MKRFRTLLFYLLAIGMALAPLAGCTQSAGVPPSEEAPPPPTPVTLSLDVGEPEDSPLANAVREVVHTFMQEHEHITVEMQFDPAAPSEPAQEAASSSEDAPSSSESAAPAPVNTLARAQKADVLYRAGLAETSFMAQQGELMDLVSVRREYPDFAENIKPDALVSMVYPDGRLYAVPVLGFYEGLFVSSTLFQENGLALPTDWEKLLAAVDAFAAKGEVTPIAVPLKNDPAELIEHLVLSAGGAKGHAQGLDAQNIPEAWTQGLALAKTLYDKKAFPKTELSGKAEAVALFNKGKAAMLIGGSWMTQQMEDSENTVVLPFPKVFADVQAQDDIIGGFGSGFYLSSRAWWDEQKREAAVLLTQALTSDKAMARYLSPAGTLAGLYESGVQLMKKANGIAMPAESYLSEEVWNSLCQSMQEIAKGETEPRPALEKALSQK